MSGMQELIGSVVRIEWRDEECDYTVFRVEDLDRILQWIKLRAVNPSQGFAPVEGNAGAFWTPLSAMDEIEELRGPVRAPADLEAYLRTL